MIKLYVAGYPFDIEEAELLEIFFFYGTVHSISLVREKPSGRHKGYGFIEMTDREGAGRVIEAVNGMKIRGRELTVKVADQPKVQGAKPTKQIASRAHNYKVAPQPGANPIKRPRRRVNERDNQEMS